MAGNFQWSNVTPNLTVNPKDTVANPLGVIGAAGAEMLASYQKLQDAANAKISEQHLADSLGQLASLDPSQLDGTVLRQMLNNPNLSGSDKMKLLGGYNTLKQQGIENAINARRIGLAEQGQQFSQDMDTQKLVLDRQQTQANILNMFGSTAQNTSDALTAAKQQQADAQAKLNTQRQTNIENANATFNALGLTTDFANPNLGVDNINAALAAMNTNPTFSKIVPNKDDLNWVTQSPAQFNKAFAGTGDAGSDAVAYHNTLADALVPQIISDSGNRLSKLEARQVASKYLPEVLKNVQTKPGAEPSNINDLVKMLKDNPSYLRKAGFDFGNKKFATDFANFEAQNPNHSSALDAAYSKFKEAQQAQQQQIQADAAAQQATKARQQQLLFSGQPSVQQQLMHGSYSGVIR